MTDKPVQPPINALPTGLTKREYFAAVAMQAVISNHTFADFGHDEISFIDAAETAVLYADALIESLEV